MKNLVARIRAAFEAPRFCRTCGEELSIDAVALYDKRTGKVARHRWAVACDAAGLSFSGDRHWSGNGATYQHTMAMDLSGPPSWVPAYIAASIKEEADDYGYLRGRSVSERFLDVLKPLGPYDHDIVALIAERLGIPSA